MQAVKDCTEAGLNNGSVNFADIPDGMATQWLGCYAALIPDKQYDVIIIDGIYRTEMLEWAIEHLKAVGGYVFIDNLDQDYVWISPRANELVEPLEGEIFIQPKHIAHEGKPWNSRYYIIPKR